MNDATPALMALRVLKGIPLTLVMAMAATGAPVSQSWLGATLGYEAKTVRKHLQFLLLAGYVERLNDRRWQLRREGLELPGLGLPSGESYAQDHDGPPQDGRYPQEKASYPQDGAKRTKKGVDFTPFSPTTTTCSHEKIGKSSSSKSRGKQGEILPVVVRPELAAALQEAGIGRKLWPELAALDHVTPAYVRAHTAAVRAHPDPKKRNTRFLIHVLRDGDPAPELCAECGGLEGGHAHDCRTYYARYTQGKYGDLFER